ncbi:hypothetical protein V7161_30210 [Neobacillus drentensis]
MQRAVDSVFSIRLQFVNNIFKVTGARVEDGDCSGDPFFIALTDAGYLKKKRGYN